MVQYLVALQPVLLTLAFYLIGVSNWSRRKTWPRVLAFAVTLLLAARYLAWRFQETVLPQPFEGFGFYWVWFVFAVECLAVVETSLLMLVLSRYVDRSTEADRYEAALFSGVASSLPTVDVFIPTVDEPLSVLERTIIGARALDYPADKLRIYVLDDGRREWLRAFCLEKGVDYVTRSDRLHAKAGNLNNGLAVSDGEFLAVFDADFVPYRQFLRRTLGFFADPKIGIVQTPQHFFNKDPIQTNLCLEHDWPDEQRLFFDEVAASRDAWNVSFCCGSCSVLRREAIDAIGGIPTKSITEDLLTTLACLNKGYVTRYLNERLSVGLAAEDIEGYFIQRSRWCRGGIQTLFLRNGPLLGPGLTLLQRIMFVPTSWLVQYVVRFVALVVPPVFLLTGLAPMYFTGLEDIVHYQLPVLVGYFLFMRWVAPSRYLPLVSSAVATFTTFRMLPVVIASLVKPFGTPFRVTPKGVDKTIVSFDRFSMACISVVLAATTVGLFVNVVPEWSTSDQSAFSTVAVAWAAVNIVVLILATAMCYEAPRRWSARFNADEEARVVLDGRVLSARLTELSLDRSRLRAVTEAPARIGDVGALELGGVVPFPVRLRDLTPTAGGFELALEHGLLAPKIREQMITKLYTGSYSQDIGELKLGRIVGGLWRRAFGATRQAAGHAG